MDDHERFTRQMNDTMEVLREAIDALDAPIAQKDKLSGLARNLREFAYQAGRTEDAARIPVKNRIVERPGGSQQQQKSSAVGISRRVKRETETN